MWKSTTNHAAVCAAAALLTLTACVEQDGEDLETVPPATEETTPTLSGFTDESVTRVLDVLNTAEIQEADIARSKTQNAEVKRFAELMIQDHQQMANDTRATSATSATDTGALPQTGTGRGTTGTPATPATGHEATTTPNIVPGNTTMPPATGAPQPGATVPMPQNHTMAGSPETIVQQLQQESEAARSSWQNLAGAEFDRVYMERQVTAHQNALELLDRQLLPGTQSAELRQTLTIARTTIERHLDEARRIQQSLGAGGTSTR